MAFALLPSLRSSPVFNAAAWGLASSSFLLRPFPFSLPKLQYLWDLFPPFLLAVPKKKVSHSRKAMRSANKGAKERTNIVHCPGCGAAKLAHHLCPHCYSEITRGFKKEAHDRSRSGSIVELD
ncbi:hypothetical protein BD410DRAFT_759744 [Rickenella mellea]|uniref:Large ribosomal subunit protein bL32m n=1 Tax=Rickenella mellea TaxID=50990 RepID=A0A4Y7QM96_9AGAM|nr:hypothetical protein BD410DRAFT_759744 [Rickenella mellea]